MQEVQFLQDVQFFLNFFIIGFMIMFLVIRVILKSNPWCKQGKVAQLEREADARLLCYILIIIIFFMMVYGATEYAMKLRNTSLTEPEIIAHDISFYSESDEEGRSEFSQSELPLYLYLEYENSSESAITIVVKEEYGNVSTETDYMIPGGTVGAVKTWLQIARSIDIPAGEHKITVAHKNNPEKIIAEKYIKITEALSSP